MKPIINSKFGGVHRVTPNASCDSSSFGFPYVVAPSLSSVYIFTRQNSSELD